MFKYFWVLKFCDEKKRRYTFKFIGLPLTLICDWGADEKPLKKNNEESFMIKEYYFYGKLIKKTKNKTITLIPKTNQL